MKYLQIAILTIIGLFICNSVYADNYDFEVDGLCYKIMTSTTVEVTRKSSEGDDYSGNIIIPSSVNYGGKTYSVTSIGEYVFYKCSDLTSITIPNTVTGIGSYAFAYCALYSTKIPNSVASIGDWAFAGCSSLTSVTIPNSVTKIGSSTFYRCSALTSITIPNSVTSIGNGAFYECTGLTSVTISNSVTKIGSSTFYRCSALTSITIPNSVTNIGDDAFAVCSGLTSITIPNSVTSIGEHAFDYCTGLTSITIPNSVTSIGAQAFAYCSGLTSVTIPNSVTSISERAFEGCSGLESINVDSSNIIYDSRDNCNAIIETKNNTLITGCKNTIIPNSVTSIGGSAFAVCSGLTLITIPNGVTSIGEYAFSQCYGLTSITIPNSVTSIGEYAFGYCTSLTSLTIPNSVTSIGSGAFNKCTGLTSFTIPNSVTIIYHSTFMDCTGLTSVTIPNSVTSIAFYAFSGCSKLAHVKSEITNPFDIYENVFQRISSNAILQVPKGTRNLYKKCSGWVQHFKEIVEEGIYTLSIKATGNGSVSYDGNTIRNTTGTFTVNEGASATITFTPDNGNSIASVKLNNSDVTSQVSGNRYTINNTTANTTLAVTFQEDVNAFTVDGVNYIVVSQADRTVKVTDGDFGQVLTVPATVTQNGKTWTVTGIDANALKNNTELAAVIWNPTYDFTATVSNPNLLLYVKAEQYAPSSIQNVVVNGTASNIVLKEASSGNNFYCPQTFVAQKISYTHNYQMQTGLGESKGWETIALPFDVQTITHETKGTIVPFAQWKNESNKKPFWLMELTGTGFVEASSIKAYTPYIISMPNHPQYDSQWLLKGKVTFAASSVTIGKTENLNQPVFNGRTFIPCFAEKKADEGFYTLNVNNDWETNNSGMTEGSKFVLNMRRIHPFEAYMTSSSNAAPYFDVFDDMTTGIQVMDEGRWMKEEAVYDLQGRKVENPSKKGVYIVNGKKMIIK